MPFCAAAAGGSGRRAAPAESNWERALRLRAQLEARPAQQRTREQFEQALDAFRLVYHQSPGTIRAPASVAAVADLLAEKGRVFSDPRALRSAIGQYDFLRRQYPHSEHTANALLLEAEICRQDLNDQACAEEKLRQTIAEKPGSSYAEQAALELKQMEAPGATTRKNSRVAAPGPPPEAASAAQPTNSTPEKSPSKPSRIVLITGIRHWSSPTSTRIAIDLDGKVEYEAARVPNPDRIFFDLHGARLANRPQAEAIDEGNLRRIRTAQYQPDVARVVLDVTGVSAYSALLLPNPWRMMIDIPSEPAGKSTAKPVSSSGQLGAIPGPTTEEMAQTGAEPERIAATEGWTGEPVAARKPQPGADPAEAPVLSAKARLPSPPQVMDPVSTAHPAGPTAEGERSLVRALGLKVGRIVIDAGHGGHDSGTVGPGGLEEKDVVLDVALRLGKLLHQRLGAEIVYTRSEDTFIPLETRTAIANKAQADLFLSIHANSSAEPSARGVETYYLNFTSDPAALDVAARENALSSQSVHQLSDLVRKITLKDKIQESREFAANVDASLFAGLKGGNPGLRDRGAKKAPFVVLIGAQMPSILAEISFLTNPQDARQLREGGYRQRIAESLDAGVERYLRGLSGARPLEKSKIAAHHGAVAEVAGR